jgi:glycosyltransferase involved in cell wall biosynthesis
MPSVLLVTQDLQRAGAQRQCVELALGLRRRQGWRVGVAALEPDGPLAGELADADVPLFACPRRWRWDLSPVRKLADLTRREGFEIVHSFLFLPNFYVRFARFMHRPSVVVSSHRSTGVRGWPRYVLEVLLAPLCDVVIANSDSGRQALLARGVSAGRVAVVRNGLDLARFQHGSEPLRETSPNGGRTIGMVARMEADKDHELLVVAMHEVLARHRDARLLLAGDGTLRPQVERRIRDLGIGSAVECLGDVQRTESVYSRIDIYVQASAVKEGTSNSIIEAMASGRPVIATDLGGNREVVQTGETGLLVPSGDPAALAGAILSLMEDPAIARRMGAAGAARAARVYSRDSMVSATVAVYEAFLGRSLDPA